MSSISSVRLPRSDLWTPTASYSASFQPTPAPRMTRFSDRNWSVASSLASITGLRSGMIRIEVPEADALRRAGRDGQRRQRLEQVDRVEPLGREQVVGDEERVEPELLDRPRELLDAPRPLRAVALPDVRRQEDPEPSDLSHVRCNLHVRSASSAVILRVALREERARRPRACPSLAKTRSDASSSAARPASRSSLGRQVDQALRLADRERAARGDLLADGRGARDGLAGRHDLVDEADPLRLGGSR